MSKFSELLAQLQAEGEAQTTLAKALPQNGQDDATIQAAAADGDNGEGGNGGDGDGEGDGDGDGEGDLAKSLTLANGEQAIDATELLKALQETSVEHDELLTKALPMITTMFGKQAETIAQLGDLVKSLQADVKRLGGVGTGRKSQVVITERASAAETTLAKSEPDGLTPQEFLLKSENAFNKGKISGLEFTTIDVCIREGKTPALDLIQKVANS